MVLSVAGGVNARTQPTLQSASLPFVIRDQKAVILRLTDGLIASKTLILKSSVAESPLE
jgi:hypothetical protein